MGPQRHTPESVARLRSTLLDSARRLIIRDGAGALTMRALAAEAGCAVGLPYKVFADRRALVAELLKTEMERLMEVGTELIRRAGQGSVASNLDGYARAILDSPAVALADEVMSDEDLAREFAQLEEFGTGPGGFQTVVSNYLAAEKDEGRVAAEVDVEALGFLLAGAVHNLVMSGPAYPRPSGDQLSDYLTAAADLLAEKVNGK